MRGVTIAGVLIAATIAGPVMGSECDWSQDPSPYSEDATGITFYNDSPYAFALYWADSDGFLNEMALVQPFEEARFTTYIGHQWYVEMYTPGETLCAGPIWASEYEPCDMRVLYDEAVGLDGGYCNFIP